MIFKILEWFVPPAVRTSRTDWKLARTFVFTHLAGPLMAQPLWVYLYLTLPDAGLELGVLAAAICGFWALPFVLRATGDLWLSGLISYQALAATSLWGSYHYGGVSSPFLPWLVVSVVLGLSYLLRSTRLVLALFVLDVAVFALLTRLMPPPAAVPIEALSTLGWLSIASATIYMAWMGLHYSAVVSLRADLEAEADRSRATSKELEEARAMAEAMGHERTRFFTKMSHELRTPLNAIIGYSEILAEDLEEGGAEGQSRIKDVNRINAAGKHLLSLVSTVLDADAIDGDGDGAEAQHALVRLGDLRDEVMASALPMVERNGNAFVVTCPEPDAQVFTDPTKLRQIIINLLSNAGKFTHRGVVKMELHLDAGGAVLRAVVSDTGIGIPPDAVPRLFTEYEQVDATVHTRFGGTGIGLALCKRLSVLLGGEISVTSRVGHGSRFVVTLPARSAELRAA